jgi:hypothetical protein
MLSLAAVRSQERQFKRRKNPVRVVVWFETDA